jgi:hypothetical protein
VIAHPDTTFTPSPRRIFCSLFFVVAIGAVAATGLSQATGEGIPGATANKIDPWVFEHTADGQQAELIVNHL